MDGNAVRGLETGQILHCQWGYSMILNTFYKVVQGAVVGKMAKIQQIGKKLAKADQWGQSGLQVPDETQVLSAQDSKVVRAMVKAGYRGALTVKCEHGHAEVWDGKPATYDSYD